MGDASTKQAKTNTTPKSCVDVKCDCHTIWSLAQQFSTIRLCVESGEYQGDLIEDFVVRARRIAATYARFYLELEEGGDENLKGRYYWMALGAFASKTVACALDSTQVRTMTLVTKTVHEGLGKGNLWLFCDISGWHWYHNNHPKSFAMCIQQRNANRYTSAVKKQMDSIPWKAKALEKIKYFAPSTQIKEAFELVAEIQRTPKGRERESLQLSHLMAIADHEQRVILQPLIYDDSAFATWIQRQRAPYARWASPALELVFTHKCSTIHSSVKSVAPKNTELEDFVSRMDWINEAAEKFHGLMRKRKDFMESALGVMANWVDLPDSPKFQQDNAI
ncbi:MAG: hypothetical protein V4693_04965 [Pseudomonadota bacterium]